MRVGDPLRNIVPCVSCHGGIDHKLGAPWLEGMPKEYLLKQLKAFASGARRNDSFAQMRNMVRPLDGAGTRQRCGVLCATRAGALTLNGRPGYCAAPLAFAT